jgi:hypothetical protein
VHGVDFSSIQLADEDKSFGTLKIGIQIKWCPPAGIALGKLFSRTYLYKPAHHYSVGNANITGDVSLPACMDVCGFSSLVMTPFISFLSRTANERASTCPSFAPRCPFGA